MVYLAQLNNTELSMETLFGSRVRALLLGEIAKATVPINASSLARVFGIDAKYVYEEIERLSKAGILCEVTIGKNRKGYLYSESKEARKLKEFIRTIIKSRREGILELISSSFSAVDYYVSLPISLTVSFDVFYSPPYLLLFVRRELERKAKNLLNSLGKDGLGIVLKPVSLWGRDFIYDEERKLSLATNEQAIADGLNYYDEIRDTEVIRTILARSSVIDINSLWSKLNKDGASRLRTLIRVMEYTARDGEIKNLWSIVENTNMAKDIFVSDLEREVTSLLLSGNQTYRNNTLNNATENIACSEGR